MTRQTILVSDGAVEYTYPVTLTETTGEDISADTVQISLGTWTQPLDWATPDLLTRPTTSSVTAQMLVRAGTVPAGMYWVWLKVTDSPEVAPRRADLIVTVR